MCVIFRIRVAGKYLRTTMMGVMFHLRVTEGKGLRATTVCILFQFKVSGKKLRVPVLCQVSAQTSLEAAQSTYNMCHV